MMNRLKRVHWLQSVYIRFKAGEDGMIGLRRLNALVQGQSSVSVDDRDKLVIFAVLTSRNWGMDTNRNFQVHHLQFGDQNQVREMFRDVEAMTVGDHGASAICSGRLKKQQDEVKNLIGAIVTHSFFNEIVDWGVDIDAKLIQPDDPALEFVLRLDGTSIATIQLDGFSGRMAVDDVWGDELFMRCEQLQKLIRETMMKKLEELTA